MNFILFWKLLSELSTYFALAQFLATPLGASGSLLPSCIALVLTGTLGRGLDRAGHPRWRWAALLLAVPAFAWAKNWIDVALLALPTAYVFAMLLRHLGDGNYYEYHDQYKFGLKLMGGVCALLLVFWSAGRLSAHILPYVFCFLVGGVLALRLLRHSEEMLNNPRLRAYNLLSMAALCGAGWLITSEAAMRGLKAVLGALFEALVVPVITLLSYLMGLVMMGLWTLISKIGYQGESEMLNDLTQQADEELAQAFEQGPVNEVPANVILGAIILVAFVLLAILLFRFLKKPRPQRENAIHEVRTTIDGAVRNPREKLFDRDPRARVRATYRKFLALLSGSGEEIRPTYTTADIDVRARSALGDPPGTERLREVYRRARYGEAEIAESDADEAKRAYREIRDHVRKRK